MPVLHDVNVISFDMMAENDDYVDQFLHRPLAAHPIHSCIPPNQFEILWKIKK